MFGLHQNRADDTGAEFVQLYAKMAQTLAVSGVVGQNPSALLSIQIPGIVVPTGLDPGDPETEYYVSNLLNVAVECNYVLTPKAGLTSDTYKLILDGKETPLVELSPEEKKRLRDSEDYLYEPGGGGNTPAFQAYIDCAARFYAAQDALSAEEATYENGGPEVRAETRRRYEEAKTHWRSQGNKDEVEAALSTIQQLQARDPYVYWQALADRFARGTVRLQKNSSEFQRVDSFPRYREWFRDELWTPFTFDENDYKHQRRSGGIGMRGQGRCCCDHGGSVGQTEGFGEPGAEANTGGPWREQTSILAASKAGQWAAERGPDRSVATAGMMLRCSIKRVAIVRPWMDVSVFHSRLWKWSAQSIGRGIVISTGGSVAANQTASGVLPVLPTTALLAKDIEVAMFSREAFDWMERKLRTGHKVRYGPFLLDRIRAPLESEQRATPAIAGVASGAPELFGFISTIFGKCPNPDMTLSWPS